MFGAAYLVRDGANAGTAQHRTSIFGHIKAVMLHNSRHCPVVDARTGMLDGATSMPSV